MDIRATRVTGTLDVELEDGRTATLEVNLELPEGSQWGIDRDYDGDDLGHRAVRHLHPDTITYSARVRRPSQIDPPFILQIPAEEDE